MIELEIEQLLVLTVDTALDNTVEVISGVPSPKQIDNLPLVVINFSSGVCDVPQMGNRLLVDITGTVMIDVLSLNKELTFTLSSEVQKALTAKLGGIYRLTLSSFKNQIDTNGAKPIYARELTYTVKFLEDYSI